MARAVDPQLQRIDLIRQNRDSSPSESAGCFALFEAMVATVLRRRD